MAEKAGKKAGGDSSASVKKSQLLIALKEEVLKLRNEVKEESAAREQISDWISETLKPGLQRMKSQWGSQLEELQGVIQKQQEEMAELKRLVRENVGKGAPASKDRGGGPSFSSEAVSELRQELHQEKIARQQLTLWIKQHFGRKMEVLDRRILKLCDKHQKALSNGEDPVSAAAGPPPLPSSVQEWLMQIGYDRYQEHFRGMSLAQASRLNEKTLIRMEISFKRHRTDILESVKNLRHVIEQHEQARNVERSKSQPKGSVSDAEQSDAEGEGTDVDPFADVVEGSVPELERQRQEFQEKERRLEEEKQRWLEEQKQLWLEEERERIRQDERRKLAKQQQQLQQQQDLILKQQQLLEQQQQAEVQASSSKSDAKQTSQEYSSSVKKTQQHQHQHQHQPQQPTQKSATTVSSRSFKAAVLPVVEESPAVSSSSSFSSEQSAPETEDVSVPEVSSDSEEISNAPMSKAEREAAEREEMAMRALRQRQSTEKQRQTTSFVPSASSAATNKKPAGSISDRLNNKVKNDSFLALSEEEFLLAPKKSQPVTSSTAKSTSTAKSSSQKQISKIEEPEPEDEQDVEEDKPTTTRPTSSSSASKKAKSREVPVSDFEDEEAEEEVAVNSAPSPQRSPATKRKNASSTTAVSTTTTSTPTPTTSSSSSVLKTSSSSVATKDAPSNKPSGSAALEKAVYSVKNDENPLNWVLFSYDKASNTVVVECYGMEGYDELMENLDDTKVQYGLLRLIDEVTNRVKFVMITWMGPKVPVLTKARSNTKKAEALKAISPVNVEIIAEGTKENLTLENIWTQIKAKVDF